MHDNRGARYLVRVRDRISWTRQTIKGPRRIKRWGPWRTVSRFVNVFDVVLPEHVPGVRDVGVFLSGTRLTEEQLLRRRGVS